MEPRTPCLPMNAPIVAGRAMFLAARRYLFALGFFVDFCGTDGRTQVRNRAQQNPIEKARSVFRGFDRTGC